ncbi:MAG: aminopeptidase [Opitutales bacterium]
MDTRYLALADVLVRHSTALKPGENVLIEGFDVPDEIIVALIRAVKQRRAHPFVNLKRMRVVRELIQQNGSKQFEAEATHWELPRMKQMQAYIALRGAENIFETSDVPAASQNAYMGALKPVLDYRVNETRWCVLRWPTASMAQQARMSTEAFADFYFNVCTMDYARMKPGMSALKKLMDRTERVRIVGPDTDLSFSIKGLQAIACGGVHNIPDGEVFTAPVRESVEGVLSYNAPTVYQGTSFDNIRLVFEKGKIVKAESNNTRRLNQILDSDDGARYIGEFAIAFNPLILQPMQDILFDEKIAGSFHFTPGQAYEGEADNGNRSKVHWDMVCIQRKDFGGGKIYFDGKLIREDGMFLPKPLQKLNPEYLLGEARARS